MATGNCWNIFGERRAFWTNEDMDVMWDRFGFKVREDTEIYVNACFSDGELLQEDIVDCPHGLHFGPEARLHLDSDGSANLYEVCTKRGVQHWIRRMRRQVSVLKRRRMLRICGYRVALQKLTRLKEHMPIVNAIARLAGRRSAKYMP